MNSIRPLMNWELVGATLGIGPPTFLKDGRVTFRVNLPADSPFGPGMVWLATNWGTPQQFLEAMRDNAQLARVLRLAAEADPADIATPDLAPTAPVAPQPSPAPAPVDPPDVVQPSGEIDGPLGDLRGDPSVISEPAEPFVPAPDPQRRDFPPGRDLNALFKQVPKEAWVIGGILLALLVLK